MTASMFSACCPECGAELHPDESGNGTCDQCATTYLNRLGYLIPVEVPTDSNLDSDPGSNTGTSTGTSTSAR